MKYEAVIERCACERALRELGVRSLKLNVTGSTGWPDRLFFIPGGRPLFIEFKRPGEEPGPKQLHIHAWLRHIKYEVQVHDTVEGAFQAILEAIKRRSVRRPDTAT